MRASQWIRNAEKAGWLVKGPKGLKLHLRCGKQGCTSVLNLPIDNLGPVPAPCSAPHVGQYSARTFEQYTALVTELQRRRRQLGLSQEDVCAASGLADGHINKLEALDRIAQFPTLRLWAETLGFSLALLPTQLPKATTKAIEARASSPYQENQARFKAETTKRLL